MTSIDAQWAASQVEAMADGSLAPADEQRMRSAMARDPELGAAVARAAVLRAKLGRLDDVPVPRSLTRRLLAIPAGAAAPRARRRPPAWLWLAGGATTAAAAAATLAVLQAQHVREREAAAAMAQVELAMAYLRQSSQVVGNHVARAMRSGLLTAAEASRDALADDQPQSEGE